MLNEQIDIMVVFLVLYQLVMYENQLEHDMKYYNTVHKLSVVARGGVVTSH